MSPTPEDRQREIDRLERLVEERCEDEGRQEFADKLEDLRRGPDAEPEPTPGEADVSSLVIDDLKRRSDFGKRKYGTRLQTFNGRNALTDLYHEMLDGVNYVRQRIEEERWLDTTQDGPPDHGVTVLMHDGGGYCLAQWFGSLWDLGGDNTREPFNTIWRPLPPTPSSGRPSRP